MGIALFATWARTSSSVKASSGETASVCSVARKAPLAKEAIDVAFIKEGRYLLQHDGLKYWSGPAGRRCDPRNNQLVLRQHH